VCCDAQRSGACWTSCTARVHCHHVPTCPHPPHAHNHHIHHHNNNNRGQEAVKQPSNYWRQLVLRDFGRPGPGLDVDVEPPTSRAREAALGTYIELFTRHKAAVRVSEWQGWKSKHDAVAEERGVGSKVGTDHGE
jgi:hypothetical protein